MALFLIKRRLIFLFAFLWLSQLICYAQQVKATSDCGIWYGLVIKKEIGKFEVGMEHQLRTYDKVSAIDDYLADLGVNYSINKNFNLGYNLRYIYDLKRSKDTEQNLRYNLDLGYRFKVLKELEFSYRLRYQKELVCVFFSDYHDRRECFKEIRNRAELKYKYNPQNKLYLSAELFRRIEQFRDPYFNKLRFFAGDEFDTAIGEFDASLGLENELNADYPYTFLFARLIYKIKL